jgi:hypothetical protein
MQVKHRGIAKSVRSMAVRKKSTESQWYRMSSIEYYSISATVRFRRLEYTKHRNIVQSFYASAFKKFNLRTEVDPGLAGTKV